MTTTKRQPAAPPTSEPNGHDTLASDLLCGADEIARFLGWPVRRVRHQLAQGYLPHTRSGLLYVGSKVRLLRHFQG